jgi:hypothetical protein
MKTLTKNGLELNSVTESQDRIGGLNRVNVWSGEFALVQNQVLVVQADSWYQSHTVERTGSGFATLTVNYAEPFITIEWSRTVEDIKQSLYLHPRWATPTVWTGNPLKQKVNKEKIRIAVEANNSTTLAPGTGNTADEMELYDRFIATQTSYNQSSYTLHYELQYNRAAFPAPIQFSDEVLIYSYADLGTAFGSLSVQNNAPELVQTNAVPHVGTYLSFPPEMRIRADGMLEMSGFFIFAKIWDVGVYNTFA